SLGFEFALEPRTWKTGTLRLVGGFTDRMRFFAVCRPTTARKVQALFGRELGYDPDPVVSVEPGPVLDMVDIQTSTRTFFAAGLATPNCYARPSHDYLRLRPGLHLQP